MLRNWPDVHNIRELLGSHAVHVTIIIWSYITQTATCVSKIATELKGCECMNVI